MKTLCDFVTWLSEVWLGAKLMMVRALLQVAAVGNWWNRKARLKSSLMERMPKRRYKV
jgi:hypothetical protein